MVVTSPGYRNSVPAGERAIPVSHGTTARTDASDPATGGLSRFLTDIAAPA